MTNRAASSAPERRDDPNGPLTEAIVGLTDELRVLRIVLDEMRSDVQYITRNGIPGCDAVCPDVPGIRAAADADGNEDRGPSQAEHSACPATDNRTEPQDFQAVIDELKDFVTTHAQEQVNLLLSALDQVRDQLVAVIRGNSPKQARSPLLAPLPSSSNAATGQAGSTENGADVPPAKTPQQLF